MPDTAPLLSLLEKARRDGVFPGAQLGVGARGGIDVSLWVGRTALVAVEGSQPVTATTRFDIASLTKALCTSVLLMQAVGERRLDLGQRLDRWFPELAGADRITLELLASHRAGLPAHRPFFETLWAEGLTDPEAVRRRMRALVCAEPLETRPGTATRYSDLGYILLGWVLEHGFERPLDVLFRSRIAEPLGLQSTAFGPVEGPVAATEIDERGRLLWGRVHDENARVLGGVAGHAGLFSTAEEVVRLVRHLSDVHAGAEGIVNTDVLRLFWRPIPNGDFTLGWDTPTEPSSSGRYTTRGGAVGHLGFTGCSVWHDLARDVTITLLSNRVHPHRNNDAIKTFRPLLHDRVNEWLGQER